MKKKETNFIYIFGALYIERKQSSMDKKNEGIFKLLSQIKVTEILTAELYKRLIK